MNLQEITKITKVTNNEEYIKFLNSCKKEYDHNALRSLKEFIKNNNNHILNILCILNKKFQKIYKTPYLKSKILELFTAYKHIDLMYFNDKEFSKIFMDICTKSGYKYYNTQFSYDKYYLIMPMYLPGFNRAFYEQLHIIYNNKNIKNIFNFLYHMRFEYKKFPYNYITWSIFIAYCFKFNGELHGKILQKCENIFGNLPYLSSYNQFYIINGEYYNEYDEIFNAAAIIIEYNTIYNKNNKKLSEEFIMLLLDTINNVISNIIYYDPYNQSINGIIFQDLNNILHKNTKDNIETILCNLEIYNSKIINQHYKNEYKNN